MPRQHPVSWSNTIKPRSREMLNKNCRMSGWLEIHWTTSLSSTSNDCDLSGQCDLGGIVRMMASDFDFGFIFSLGGIFHFHTLIGVCGKWNSTDFPQWKKSGKRVEI